MPAFSQVLRTAIALDDLPERPTGDIIAWSELFRDQLRAHRAQGEILHGDFHVSWDIAAKILGYTQPENPDFPIEPVYLHDLQCDQIKIYRSVYLAPDSVVMF